MGSAGLLIPKSTGNPGPRRKRANLAVLAKQVYPHYPSNLQRQKTKSPLRLISLPGQSRRMLTI